MKLDLEVIAEILPSVRAEIARELVSSYNLNQGEVSRMLGVSQPAVSQYVRQLRGAKTRFNDPVRQEIRALCEKLAKEKTGLDVENEIYRICRSVAQSARAKKSWQE